MRARAAAAAFVAASVVAFGAGRARAFERANSALAQPAATSAPVTPPSPLATSSPPLDLPAFTGPDPLPTLPPPTPLPVRTLAPTAVRPAEGGAPWTAADRADLRRELDALVRAPVLAHAHVGVYAVDTRSGAVLFDADGDAVIQPASTFKLLVGSVALEKLGPTFRFRTSAYLSASGMLVLRGGGDPFLATADVDDFASAVARLGDRQAALDFAVNGSHFDRAWYAPGWTWDDFTEDYAPKISALTLEENVLHVFVMPGASPGAPAEVYAHPLPLPGLAPAAACEPTFEAIVAGGATTLSADAESTLDATFDPHGCIDLTGGIAANSSGASLDVAVPSPEAYAYRVAVDRLHARGIEVRRFRAASSPPYDDATRTDPRSRFDTRLIWTHDSLALAAILPRFWIPSDNLVGENLLKELGVASGGEPGTRAKGVALEKLWLQSIGVDPAPFTFADGCGLSQYDRISPHALVAILQHDWNGPYRELVLDALPVGGARGRIEGVEGTAASGRVWAKTGSFSHVRGLAGYVATAHHGTVTFAFNVDDFAGDYGALADVRARALAEIARR